MKKRELYEGYTVSELQEAFNSISNPKDWRAPIKAEVKNQDIDVAVTAIRFFTATSPTVRHGKKTATITSIGYRQGPAGDY
jgi:hypothetical protein